MALSFASVVHCGTTGLSVFDEGRANPCQTVFAGQCGAPCTSDEACPSGLHCSANPGQCVARCAPEETCENGATCSPRGRCGPDGTGGTLGGDPGPAPDAAPSDAVCADTTVSLEQIHPKVLLLLDQSSSMYFNRFPMGGSNGCNPDCRWSVLKDVLIGPAGGTGGLVKQLENDAELGVMLYSATDSNPNDGDNSILPPPTDNVCPRFNGKAFDGLAFARGNAAAIDAYLRPAGADDDTPTGPAIRAVVGIDGDGAVVDQRGFAAIPGTAPKVIVLVTDGEPALCGQNNPSDEGRAAVVSATQQSYALGIQTYVIAIGSQTAGAIAHFKAVANAGQGKDPVTGNADAILPSTQDQLLTAVRSIVEGSRTCTFELNGQVPPGLERRGTVTLNGAVVPFDEPGAPAEGWRLSSPSVLELVGSACETLKSSPDATLTARFPCGVVVPR